jgi:periplasmic protein TonB
MGLESRQVSGQGLGSLQVCLLEGDPEQRRRELRVRRRALIISIAAESVVLGALVLTPLLGKPARIALANVVPLPPYYSHPEARHPGDPARPHPIPPRNICRFCAPTQIPRTIAMRDSEQPDDVSDAPDLGGPQIPGAIPIPDGREGVRPPQPPPPARPDAPQVVHTAHIDPALLTHRVEPVYPTLAKQIGRSGRVELRAIIATDGTIQSLQVVNGDPLFYPSAMDAVRQWRYTPTVLNGQAVEVDTYITVIYNLTR